MKYLLPIGAVVLILLAFVGIVGTTLLPSAAAPEPPWNLATNCSGTITTGAVAQQVFASGVHHGYQIQDVGTSQLGISELTSTPAIGAAGTWPLYVSSTPYLTPPTYGNGAALFIIGLTSGVPFTCAVW